MSISELVNPALNICPMRLALLVGRMHVGKRKKKEEIEGRRKKKRKRDGFSKEKARILGKKKKT